VPVPVFEPCRIQAPPISKTHPASINLGLENLVLLKKGDVALEWEGAFVRPGGELSLERLAAAGLCHSAPQHRIATVGRCPHDR